MCGDLFPLCSYSLLIIEDIDETRDVNMCRERDSNPHDRFGSRDFKSLVSTNSTIAANIQVLCDNRMQSYEILLIKMQCDYIFEAFLTFF